WHDCLSDSPLGWIAVDGSVAAGVYARVGMGQPGALVRRRGYPRMRGDMVGQFAAHIEPGLELADGRDLLDPRCGLETGNRPVPDRGNGLHVGRPLSDLGTPAFDFPHRTARGAALGDAKSRI